MLALTERRGVKHDSMCQIFLFAEDDVLFNFLQYFGRRKGEENKDFMVLVFTPGERYDKHGAYIVRVHTHIKCITLLEI